MIFFKKRAYTLVELTIIIVIISILVGLAWPMFPKAMESTRAKEAVAALEQIRAGERIYRTEEGGYYESAGSEDTAIQNINDNLRLYLDYRTNRNWNYTIAATASTFTAEAERTTGGNAGETITINQSGTTGGTWKPD